METLIIAALASIVAFSLFFCVFLLRGRGRRQALGGCGRTESQCQCHRAGPEGPVAPLGAKPPTERCPLDAPEDKRRSEPHGHRPR